MSTITRKALFSNTKRGDRVHLGPVIYEVVYHGTWHIVLWGDRLMTLSRQDFDSKEFKKV